MTKPTKPRAKVRKPRTIVRHDGSPRAVVIGRQVCVSGVPMEGKDIRRLAAWLLKAADYLDAKEKGGG